MSLAATAGAQEGGGGEGRRRPRPAHHSLHLISGRCALRKSRASGSRRREGRRRCSHRRHHVLPRQEEHPADHGESQRRRLPPSLSPSRCTAGGAPRIPAGFPGRVPGEGQGPRSGGWRAAVSPAGAAGATQTERPWGLGKTKQRGNPNSGAENFGLFSLLFHRPVVPEERGAQGPLPIPAPVECRCVPGARRAFLFEVAHGEVGYGEMTPFFRSTWHPDRISLPDPAPWLCPRLKGGGCLDCTSSPRPLLACLHPDIYFSASFSGLES